MTVGELIEQLLQVDQNLDVTVWTGDKAKRSIEILEIDEKNELLIF